MANVVRSIFGLIEAALAKLKTAFSTTHGDATNPSKVDIKENGWRQGSILGEPLVRKLVGRGPLPSMREAGFWVVISHDCDVTQADLSKEPKVEVIFATHQNFKQPKHGTAIGQSYRALQLPTDHEIYEFKASTKAAFDRKWLVGQAPAERKLGADFIQQLAAWLASRYSRRGFADEFNERIRTANDKLKKKLKKNQDSYLVSAFYLLVEDVELPKEVDYTVTLFGSIRVEHAADYELVDRAQAILDIVEAEMAACKGIEIEHAELRSEKSISLADRRNLKRWDVFNELTLKNEPPSSIPGGD